MADFYKTFSGNSSYRLHCRITQGSQSQASNYTNVNGWLWVEKLSGSGYYTGNSGNTGSITGSIGVSASGWAPYDFSSYSSKLIGSDTDKVYHSSDGTKTASGSYAANDSNGGNFGSASGSWSLGLTRIPKAPDKPSTPVITNIETTLIEFSMSAPDNNGAAITGYDIQVSPDSSYSSPTMEYSSGSLSQDAEPLSPGVKYWIRYRATNSVGDSAWSNSATATTLSGVLIGDSGSYKGAEVLYGLDGSFQSCEVYVGDPVTETFVMAGA